MSNAAKLGSVALALTVVVRGVAVAGLDQLSVSAPASDGIEPHPP